MGILNLLFSVILTLSEAKGKNLILSPLRVFQLEGSFASLRTALRGIKPLRMTKKEETLRISSGLWLRTVSEGGQATEESPQKTLRLTPQGDKENERGHIKGEQKEVILSLILSIRSGL